MGKRDYMENKGESRQAKIFTEKKMPNSFWLNIKYTGQR
jgi:hypothetical protein